MVQNVIRLRLPDAWKELSDAEAWEMYALLSSGIRRPEVPLAAMIRLNAIRVLARTGDGSRWLCHSRYDRKDWMATTESLAALAAPLEWLLRPPASPWRPDSGWPRGAVPVSAMLDELTFADWLVIHNTLQAVVVRGDFAPLDALLPMLTRRPKGWRGLRSRLRHERRRKGEEAPPHRAAIFWWMLAVRQEFARRYPHFYPPLPDDGEAPAVTARMLAEAADAQLRALTGGDVTKEEQVMALPIARALAELNAKAREYAEMKSNRN